MSHVFEMTEEEYQVIAEAAQAQGKAPDALFRDWVESVRQHLDGEARDPDQTWFWTPEWQAKEREADADIAAGRVTYFDSDEAFLDALDERSKHADS